MRITIPSILIFGSLAFGAATSLVADDIAITNHSFEVQPVADGQENVNNMTGWVGSGSFYHVSNPTDGRFDGTSEGSAQPNPIDGVNIAGVNTGATIYQDLTATVQPGATYTLSMLVGHRKGVPFGAPVVSLIAGGVVLAEATPDAPADGKFSTFQLTYDSPASGAVLGQTLRIQIRSAGVNAQPWFDNLQLGAVLPPPPPNPNIEIANHSFEEPVLADGQYNINNTPGWVGTGSWFHVANPNNGWFAGTTAGGAVNPIDGANIAGLNTGTTMYQDLTAVVQPAISYKLTMLVGHRIGVPFGSPKVSLIAGGQVLAEAVPAAPAAGTFASFELIYNSPESGAVLGQALRVQLSSSGVSAQSWFDNLKLTTGAGVTNPPPPPPPPVPGIAIANHSFEEPVLADGQYNVNNTPGWVGSGTWWHVANSADNWFAGTSAGSSQPNPVDGANIAGLNTGATIHQDLTAVVEPAVSYKLTMLVGHRIGVPFGNPTVSLIAGGQVLAEAIPSSPAEGTFAPFELIYNSPESGAVVGQTLRIQIRSAGGNAQAWFDNLLLLTGPVPPPPSPYLTITNHSFEVQPVADGQENVNNMTGWVGSGSFYHVSNPTDGRFDGTSEGSAQPNPIDGVNIAGVNTGATIYQDLTATVQPGATYTLSMLVGHRKGVPFGAPVVSLIADGVVLAEATPDAPAEGKFATFQLTYDSPASGAVVGQTLRIQIRSAGVDAQPWFDNLQLAVGPQTPPPPPSGPDITIANQSFENPALTDGNYTINNTPGWSGFGTWWHVANPANDWFRRTSTGSTGPNPIDGSNAAGLNTGATIYQDLAAVVQPGVSYKLNMLVGYRTGVPFGRPTVSLLAGGQVLAQAVPIAPEEGTFAPYELIVYSSPESGPMVGQPLRIQISSTGRDAQPWFDNLKLTVGPKLPPPPANVAPVAKALVSPLFAVWPDQTNLMVISVNGYSAPAVFDGTLSSDADGDPLSFYWTADDDGSPFANTGVATNSLDVGLHHVTLLVVDGQDGNSETLEIEVITLADAIDELYGAVIESELMRKDKRPLLATLEGVEGAFDKGRLGAGVRQLRAFQQKVRAQVSGQYPDLAERLVAAAGQIATVVSDYIASQDHSPEAGDK